MHAHETAPAASTALADWRADAYRRFERERTRPATDLLARVPPGARQRIVDLGCGPGNSTALLAERYPEAAVIGLDSSPDMLVAARERLPQIEFRLGDISEWSDPAADLVFANAAFHWVPDHIGVMRRLAEALPPGGCLGVQMPDNQDDLFGEDGDEELADFDRLTDMLFRRVADFADEEEVPDGMLSPLLFRVAVTMRMRDYVATTAKPSGGGLKLDLDRFRRDIEDIIRETKKDADRFVAEAKESMAALAEQNDEES